MMSPERWQSHNIQFSLFSHTLYPLSKRGDQNRKKRGKGKGKDRERKGNKKQTAVNL